MEHIGNLLQKRIQKLRKITPTSSIPSSYKCDKCKDLEYIINTETNTARPCECTLIKRYRRILENSGISNQFRKMNFNNFDTNNKPLIIFNAKKVAWEYVRDFDKIKNNRQNSISFLGQVGAGKTHLSIATANSLLEEKIPVLYLQYRDVIPKLKQNMLDQEYYQGQLGKYKTAPVLLIDDLFKGKITDSDKNIIFEIVNHRYFNNLPLIASSEFKIDELMGFDQAIGSRIIEMSKGRIFQFEGVELNHRLII